MNEKRTPRITRKRAEKYKEQLSLTSLEIAGKAQELIKLRIERALHSERELDEFMNELLIHAGECNDKAKSKAIISKFDSLRIEDITKLASLVKSLCSMDLQGDERKDEATQIQMKFEDYYE